MAAPASARGGMVHRGGRERLEAPLRPSPAANAPHGSLLPSASPRPRFPPEGSPHLHTASCSRARGGGDGQGGRTGTSRAPLVSPRPPGVSLASSGPPRPMPLRRGPLRRGAAAAADRRWLHGLEPPKAMVAAAASSRPERLRRIWAHARCCCSCRADASSHSSSNFARVKSRGGAPGGAGLTALWAGN